MPTTQKFTLMRSFDGEPKDSDFQLETEELAPLQDGQILVRAEFLSVDPYMRVYTDTMTPPLTMIGNQVAVVTESRCDQFPVGSRVVGAFGWRYHTVVDVASMPQGWMGMRALPELGDLPVSYALGVCGMPGNTAYRGFLEICQPKEGETVVVTGAAGAVGSLVGQIAKLKGCRVVGFAGSDAKCAWIKSLGYDVAVNYKTCDDIPAALKEAAPKGIDCFFDNVGGQISYDVRCQMNLFGRIAVCGFISGYNATKGEELKLPIPEKLILFQQLKMEGFIVSRWDKEGLWEEGINQMTKWIQEGKIKVQETVTEGFENMSRAFIGMLKGENSGKAVVKV